MLVTLFKSELQSVERYYRDIMVCTGIFAAAALAGHVTAVALQDRAAEYQNTVREIILANPFGEGLPENIFLFLLGRNALVIFTALVLGILTYNAWPVFILLLNGAVSGFAVQMQAVLSGQHPHALWLFGVLPHGVPELGALFLACGASFYFRRLRRQGEFNWGMVLRTFFMLVLPLLVLAAAVESFITPLLIMRYLF